MEQEHKAVVESPFEELWGGALGPKIKPEPIEKTWRNEKDPTRRRATFGVFYPIWEVKINKSEDVHTKLPGRFEKTKRRSVLGVRLHFPVPNLVFSDADFRECKFHRPNEQNESKISGLTFKNCNFKSCILGGTVFRNVTFEESTFARCNFNDSQFIECQFLDCTFKECTAENAGFLSTEVDPTALLRGTPPPIYNYVGPIPDGETTAVQVTADWVEVQRKLAARLLASNTQIHNTFYSERGLFELKQAEVNARCQAFRTHPMKEGWFRLPFRALQLLGAWAILKLTRGGTSLSRLFLSAIIIVSFYAVLLSISNIKFMGQDCHLSTFDLWHVLLQFARAISLFLAIGYTAFAGGVVATVFLTAAAALGLFWYALVAAIVIHRVYR